jgi:hypothetical protein
MADVSSPAAAARAAANGGTANTQLDSKLSELLRQEIAQRRVRVDELQAELDALKPELRRYERVLAQLSDDPAEQAAKPGPKGKAKGTQSKAGVAEGKGIGDERVAGIRDAILVYAEDHDEFRQVDIRTATGESNSGIMTLAFERLRQDGVIRFARQDGNNKWFRLTRQAARTSKA